MIGRILLANITHKLGDRRMVFIYIFIGLGLQLVFWFVSDVAVDAIAISLLSFVICTLLPRQGISSHKLTTSRVACCCYRYVAFQLSPRSTQQFIVGRLHGHCWPGWVSCLSIFDGHDSLKSRSCCSAADYGGIAGWNVFMLGPHSAGPEESVMC